MTYLLMITGTIFMLAGTGWSRMDWKRLNMTFPQIYQEAKSGRLPHSTRWRTALSVVGFALFCLSVWRQLSGL
jgi:hypothetical protein